MLRGPRELLEGCKLPGLVAASFSHRRAATSRDKLIWLAARSRCHPADTSTNAVAFRKCFGGSRPECAEARPRIQLSSMPAGTGSGPRRFNPEAYRRQEK